MSNGRILLKFVLVLLQAATFVQAQDSSATKTDLMISRIGRAVSDGRENFEKIFHFVGNNKVSYDVTREFPADDAMASKLEKAKPNGTDKNSQHNLISYNAYVKRVREGYKSIYNANLYVSDNGKCIFEEVDGDGWNRGYVVKRFFSSTNVIELKPSEKSASILQKAPESYPELLTQFPMLYNAMGMVTDEIKMIPDNKGFMFGFATKGAPVLHTYTTDANGLLLSSDKVTWQKKILRHSEFKYSEKSSLWPAQILTKVFDANGNLQIYEVWQLIDIKDVPKDFSFDPSITKDYHVQDMTGSHIPQDEIHHLLQQ
jgi:hypothetical protein